MMPSSSNNRVANARKVDGANACAATSSMLDKSARIQSESVARSVHHHEYPLATVHSNITAGHQLQPLAVVCHHIAPTSATNYHRAVVAAAAAAFDCC